MREHDPNRCDCLMLETVLGTSQETSAWVHPSYMDDGDDDGEIVPPPLPTFAGDHDTDPLGFTVVGPLMAPRKPESDRERSMRIADRLRQAVTRTRTKV